MADVFLGIVIGLALGALFAVLRAGWAGVRSQSVAEEASLSEPADTVARLQAMTAELTVMAETSAHPREVASNPQFRQAVALLASEHFEVARVTDYAVGANRVLSAAALAALSERPDRGQAAATVARQFRHLRPWPVFYALQFFLTLEERPLRDP